MALISCKVFAGEGGGCYFWHGVFGLWQGIRRLLQSLSLWVFVLVRL